MSTNLRPVLARYDPSCQPTASESLGGAGGLSGSRFWRLTTPRGSLCLRRFAPGLVDPTQLNFIRDVLQHASRQAMTLPALPIPIAARDGRPFVPDEASYWDLTPWLLGKPVEAEQATPRRLGAAMQALARFHRAAELFPRPPSMAAAGHSGAVKHRLSRLRQLAAGQMHKIAAAAAREGAAAGFWTDAASQLEYWFRRHAGVIERQLIELSLLSVPLQPCIGDVWRENVLFDESDNVLALLDFASLRWDSVATDVARLLGSFLARKPDGWDAGLAAYEAIRPLAEKQRQLAILVDRASILLSGWNWLEWLFVDRRKFESRQQVEARMRHFLSRLPMVFE